MFTCLYAWRVEQVGRYVVDDDDDGGDDDNVDDNDDDSIYDDGV